MVKHTEKLWGKENFWGLGFEFDPQWILNEEEKILQEKLIQLSEKILRKNAVLSDKNLTFPRANFEALAELGLLGLLVPKELSGLGASHQCAAMVVETIARYGCPSTAMCYTMHLGAVAGALFSYYNPCQNPNELNHYEKSKRLLETLFHDLDKKILIGTLSFSDPETGSHFWYPLSSRATEEGDFWRLYKKASWTTSGGFADWYIIQTSSPNFKGNYADLSCFLVLKDEIKAEPSQWNGLGLRGNQSGPLLVDNILVPKERLMGGLGAGARINDEIVDPFFLLCSSSCWNGIALGAIDIVKKHTTRKTHADVGLRVCDYPTIQDYVGESIIDVNSSRAFVFQLAQALDKATDHCHWQLHGEKEATPRTPLLHWLWQLKFMAAKTVDHVCTKMLHACGGSGYKPELEIERYLRDGKAAWLMGPTNEVLRQFVGKLSLLGPESLDYWNQVVNERALNNELKKLTPQEKQNLAHKLLEKV